MKNKTLIFTGLATLLCVGGLTACGPSKPAITMWVGNESADFYKTVADDFLKANPEFPYSIKITGADTGSAAGPMTQDNTACADIITIAHDNIGKLSQKSLIVPITDESLLTQINNDNPEAFKKVIKNKLGASADAKEYTFGVPYISQALFLYYNKKYVTPEQAQTFEGLTEAAKKVNKKAYTITGTDSFNLSFTTLAVREKDKRTTVKIYDDFKMKNCFYQGNDTVAVTRWAQDSFADPNGGMMPTSSGYAVDMQGDNCKVISVIGGAWHFETVKKSIGEENLGCALIPTFKLGAKHVEGLTANEFDDVVPAAGDEYRGGTFADCKCFVINQASDVEKTDSINQILKYFSSKEVQNASFKEAGNVPAYKGAGDYIESIKAELESSKYEMAVSQTKMAEYGIAQPFMTGILNTYFYSKGVDAIYKEALVNENNAYGDLRKVRELLYTIEHTWSKGGKPAEFPDVLPAAMPTK